MRTSPKLRKLRNFKIPLPTSKFGITINVDIKNTCISVPLGLGAKIIDISKNSKLEIEIISHFVNSDWVDGVAGPNSYSNDTYIFTTINYSISIGKTNVDPNLIKHPQKAIIIDTNICTDINQP